MKMDNLVKIEADVVFEDEEFGEMLERLSEAMPEAYVRVLRYEGSGGGWPEIEVLLPAEMIAEFAEWYCADDADYWVEEFKSSAVGVK